MRPPFLLLPLPLVLLAAACTAPGDAPEEPARDPDGLISRGFRPRPFPAAFQEPAILVAKRVSIEGPRDLLEHVALRPDPTFFTYSTRTTEKGLVQEVRKKAGVAGGEIRCQLDNWQIAALEHLVVLQRPGEVPVTVVADGEVYYAGSEGEQRGPRLQFRYAR